MGLGSAIAASNAWLSFGRPTLHSRRFGSLEGYKHISGAPAIGTLALLLGVVCSFSNPWMALVAILATVLDTGGLPWFVVMTWSDSGLWDGSCRDS